MTPPETLSTEPAEPTRPRVQSAARTINILLEVAQSEKGLTTKEISERTGIGRQATYHLVHTLLEARMLTRTGGRRYVREAVWKFGSDGEAGATVGLDRRQGEARGR
jgi:DNA-binding IclR family transcriptional regulator